MKLSSSSLFRDRLEAGAVGDSGSVSARPAPVVSNDPDRPEGPRVLIDGLNLALEEGTGVATYARNLSSSLCELGFRVGALYGRPAGERDDLLREVSFFDPVEERGPRWLRNLRAAGRLARAAPGVRAQPIRLTGAVIADDFRARLPQVDELHNVPRLFEVASLHFDLFGRPLRVRLQEPPDVMHWTYPVPVQVVGARNIYTVHDLVPLRLPHTTLDRKRRYLRLMRWLAARADHLVTVSEASRRDIMDLMDVPPGRITNTYQSVEAPGPAALRPAAAVAAEVEGIFGLPYKGYFLFFGAIEPKKNIGRLIQAHLATNLATPLVLVGKEAWKSSRELRLLGLDAARGSGRIIRIDYVPRQMLTSLIQGAKAVLFPSLYEGFGLPVLEAMSLGAPVITSNTSSLPEVAGDAALLIDPYDTRELSEAIRTIDADAELRAELSRRGAERARVFSRTAYRMRLAELYAGLGLPGARRD